MKAPASWTEKAQRTQWTAQFLAVSELVRNGCLVSFTMDMERPPFRPDRRRNREGLGLRLGMRLCRMSRHALKSSPAESAAVATVRSSPGGW